MPTVYFREQMVANATQDVALAPYDRFGGGGGRVRVRCTVPTLLGGTVDLTVMLGSDVIVSAGPIGVESVAGGGPTNESPSVAGIGAPGDPITIRLAENAGGTPMVSGVVDIQNA